MYYVEPAARYRCGRCGRENTEPGEAEALLCLVCGRFQEACDSRRWHFSVMVSTVVDDARRELPERFAELRRLRWSPWFLRAGTWYRPSVWRAVAKAVRLQKGAIEHRVRWCREIVERGGLD